MAKSESYFIEILDNGFVVKHGNSKRAIETVQKVEEILLYHLKEMIKNLNKSGTNNMVVNITVDENVPRGSIR